MTVKIRFPLALILTTIAYFKFYRPRQMRWGATDAEVRRPMQGDTLVLDPNFNATRAITVNATPDQIFPWLVQMGCNRAGWYSYDWLDNEGKPSAELILPEF